MSDLPIDDVCRTCSRRCAEQPRALLIAPPGAGKTTRVAPALLAEAGAAAKSCCSCRGGSLRVRPPNSWLRRAARSRARRLDMRRASTARSARATRVIAMTHGVFLPRIQADPELAGVSAVLFDEVHERSLDNDLALALALDAAGALRPDLTARRHVGDARCRSLPDACSTTPRRSSARARASRSRSATSAATPRRASNRRWRRQSARRLATMKGRCSPSFPALPRSSAPRKRWVLPADVELHNLHGGDRARAQRAALAATSAGQAQAGPCYQHRRDQRHARRRPDRRRQRPCPPPAIRPRRWPHAAGHRAREPRRGHPARRARGAPGAGHRDPPVGRSGDRLAPGARSARDPRSRPFEPVADLPPVGRSQTRRAPALPRSAARRGNRRSATEACRRSARSMPEGRLTDHGRAIAALPLEPRLAHMLIDAKARGFAAAAADVAVLLTERGLGGNDPDLELRWRRWRADRSPRAEAREAGRRLAAALARRDEAVTDDELGQALALAFPDRRLPPPRLVRRELAIDRRARLPARPRFIARQERMARGRRSRGPCLGRAHPVGCADRPSATSSSCSATGSRHGTTATSIRRPDRSRRPAAGALARSGFRAVLIRRLTRLRSKQALLDGVREHGLDLLPWDDRATQLRHRAAFAHRFDLDIPSLDDAMLIEAARRVARAAARREAPA